MCVLIHVNSFLQDIACLLEMLTSHVEMGFATSMLTSHVEMGFATSYGICVCVLIHDIVCVVVRRERLILFVRCLLAADLAPTWSTIYR